jgi:diguanylate cyclase (GGDEF)-like protein
MPTEKAKSRTDDRQRTRLSMTWVSTTNYAVSSAGLGLFAAVGTVPWWIPALYFAVTMAGSAFFLCVIRSGLNLRFKESNLLMPQMTFAGIVLLGALFIAPRLAFPILSGIFVTALFGVMQFTLRQTLYAVIFVGLGTGASFAVNWDKLALPASTPAEVLLLWIMLMLALARFSVVSVQMEQLRNKLRDRNQQLEQSLARIQELADHDELTGVLNRRCFMRKLEEERARADRTGASFCVALFDLDHFKQVNDQYGHLVGDTVLKGFCETVTANLRNTDRFGRFGGEEFAMLLTHTPLDTAPLAVERIRAAFAERRWDGSAPGLHATVSAGISTYRAGDGVQTVLDEADRALYAAKHGGRDRVAIFAPPA